MCWELSLRSKYWRILVLVLVRNGELTVVDSVSASEQSGFKDGSDDEVDLQRCRMITSSVRQEA